MTDANGDASFEGMFPIADPPVRINATATNASGSTSEFFLNQPQIQNISTRGLVEPGENALIGGFILRSLAEVVVRALGPSLSASGVANPLDDPALALYRGDVLLLRNDNWRDNSESATRLETARLAPSFSREAAADLSLISEGAHSVVVQAKSTTGVGLVEIYDLSRLDLANVSTRGFVGSGDAALIGGVILAGGDLPTRLVARGLGPSLASAGIASPLANPTLELRDSNGILLAQNDDWRDSQEAEIRAVGVAPQDDAESVILLRVPSGGYTAIVRGKGDTTGVGLVELYNVN